MIEDLKKGNDNQCIEVGHYNMGPRWKKGTGGRQDITIANVGTNENDGVNIESRMDLDSHVN